MKKLLFSVAAVAAFGALNAQDTVAQTEPKLTDEQKAEAAADAKAEEESDSGFWTELSVDLLSDYMWRGVILNNNWCWQPSVSIGYNTEDFGGIYFNYWGSYDFTHRRNSCAGGGNSRMRGGVQEDDYYLGYTKSFGNLDLEAGYYWYVYPNNHGGHCAGHLGMDFYAGAFYNNDWVTPGVEVLWACANNNGHEPGTAYYRFSVKHDFEIESIEGLTITPKATLGVGNVAFVQNNTGMSGAQTQMTDQTLTLKASYAVTDNFSVGVNANYTWTPSRTLRHQHYMDCGDSHKDQIFWGGFNATLSF